MKYRKKPVLIEAVQFTGTNFDEVETFMGFRPGWTTEPPAIFIETLEGTHRADPFDYIIRGVKGEHYPIKPDIFALTYEPEEG